MVEERLGFGGSGGLLWFTLTLSLGSGMGFWKGIPTQAAMSLTTSSMECPNLEFPLIRAMSLIMEGGGFLLLISKSTTCVAVDDLPLPLFLGSLGATCRPLSEQVMSRFLNEKPMGFFGFFLVATSTLRRRDVIHPGVSSASLEGELCSSGLPASWASAG